MEIPLKSPGILMEVPLPYHGKFHANSTEIPAYKNTSTKFIDKKNKYIRIDVKVPSLERDLIKYSCTFSYSLLFN